MTGAEEPGDLTGTGAKAHTVHPARGQVLDLEHSFGVLRGVPVGVENVEGRPAMASISPTRSWRWWVLS